MLKWAGVLFCLSFVPVAFAEAPLDLENEDMGYGLVLGSHDPGHVADVLSAASTGYDAGISAINVETDFAFDPTVELDLVEKTTTWTVVGIETIEVAYGVHVADPKITYLVLECGVTLYVAIDFVLDEHLLDPDLGGELQHLAIVTPALLCAALRPEGVLTAATE